MIDESNDFGFLANDANESFPENVEELKQNLRDIRKIYLPFLEALAKDPDKPTISWPNRKSILDYHINKLKELTKVSER